MTDTSDDLRDEEENLIFGITIIQEEK